MRIARSLDTCSRVVSGGWEAGPPGAVRGRVGADGDDDRGADAGGSGSDPMAARGDGIVHAEVGGVRGVIEASSGGSQFATGLFTTMASAWLPDGFPTASALGRAARYGRPGEGS